MRYIPFTLVLASAGTAAICLAPAASADATGPTAQTGILSAAVHLLPPDPVRLLPPDPVRVLRGPILTAPGAPAAP